MIIFIFKTGFGFEIVNLLSVFAHPIFFYKFSKTREPANSKIRSGGDRRYSAKLGTLVFFYCIYFIYIA